MPASRGYAERVEVDDVRERLARAKTLAAELPSPRPPAQLVISVIAASAMFIYGVIWLLHRLHVPDVIVYGIGSLLTWFVITGVTAKRGLQRLSGRLDRTPVVIVGKHLHRDASIRMRFLVIENVHGDRSEHIVSRRVYETANVGDVGVLFSRQGQVWGFHRV